jgi:hypothetical protein
MSVRSTLGTTIRDRPSAFSERCSSGLEDSVVVSGFMSEVYVLGIRNLGISEYQIAAKQFDRLT